MALTLDDFLETVKRSRAHLLKHLDGLTAEQWAWKPYPECKNVRETATHLLWVDRSAQESLETGEEPDFGPLIEALEKETAPLDNDALLASLAESHAKLTAMDRFWFSILIAWVCKVITLRYGGVALYRKRLPVFIGLVLSESLFIGLTAIISLITGITVPPFLPT